MKSRLILIVLSISVCLGAMAQLKRWTVSLMGGPTLTTLVGGDVSDIKSGIGWGIGVEGEYRLTNLLGLSVGMVYTKNKFKSDEDISQGYPISDYIRVFSNIEFVQEHLQAPVMLDFHPVSHLVLKAGVQPRFLLSANMSCHVSGSYADYSKRPDYPFSTDELPRVPFEYEQKTQVRKTFDKVGIAIPFGMSYEWRNIVIDGRCSYSLSAETGSYGNTLFLMLSLGYKFNM